MSKESSRLDRFDAASSLPVSFVVSEHASPALTLEVIVRWGHSVLSVAHVDPERGFSLGRPRQAGEHVDFLAGPELLGCEHLQLLTEDIGGGFCAVLPDPSRVSLLRCGQRVEGDALLAWTKRDMAGAVLLPMALGSRLRLRLPGLEVDMSLTSRAASLPHSLLDVIDRDVPLYFGASAATFLSLLGALAFFTPPLGLQGEEQLDRKRLLLISQYLDAASEREREQTAEPTPSAGNDGGTAGKQAAGDEGAAGKVDGPKQLKRASVQGPQDNPELKLSRSSLLAEAREAGMIGLLRADQGSTFSHPVFGRDETLGNADVTAQGSLWGDELGESSGTGGLGLSGIGFGGGDPMGDGVGIGRGPLGTIGLGTGQVGTGAGTGRPAGIHVAKGPVMRTAGDTAVSGRLPAQVIQRVVRQNFGRLRMCYEQGLARNPNLEGRVSVRFVIGRDGAVSAVSGSGDLPDAGATSCVMSAFYGIAFPAPENGIVKVTYPLMFSPN